ncbi:precorrin-6A synthase (deacetylating) [Tessaracoccus massiliensis]|uniref:precorrin-6A synthase (deacetylating) n=1 Tax=Tessaracoccus massiliensis TaxID=1522311 RepID=UPI0006950169|nr:precorrin-6A synthase (deacetylating) [Tessaracoccus massiliensis]
MSREVLVIGMGPGGFGQLTLDAVEAMNRVDVFLVADQPEDNSDLVWRRSEFIRRHVKRPHRIITVLNPAQESAGSELDEARRNTYQQLMGGLPDGSVVGFLAWGDPALYDSILRVIDALRAQMALRVKVIPGVSALQVLAAAHQLALTGSPVHLTTGARLLGEYRPELGDVVVFDDAELACRGLVQEFPDLEIYWGAYLGSDDEVLANGPLGKVIDEIAALRAQLAGHHGWVHDTYLLRLPA